MSSLTILLVISCVGLAFGIGLTFIKYSVSRPVNAPLLILVGLTYIIHYNGILSKGGWPSDEVLPWSFRLLSAQVYPSNKITGTSGETYVWVSDMDDQIGRSTQRDYRLEYTPVQHSEVDKSIKEIIDLDPQMGENAQHHPTISANHLRTQIMPKIINFYAMTSKPSPEK